MEIHNILVFLGALLLLIGIAGGGFKIKEITMPKVGMVPRIIAFVLGTVFVVGGLAIYLEKGWFTKEADPVVVVDDNRASAEAAEKRKAAEERASAEAAERRKAAEDRASAQAERNALRNSLKPLKLYWSSERGDNFATATSIGEKDAIKAGYTYVRSEGYVFQEQYPDTVPLKLFWSAKRGDNFTTATSIGEKDAIKAGYEYIRIEAYVFPANYCQ